MRISFLLLLALWLPGCMISKANVNSPLEPERLAELQPGTTTAREVVELLGAPNEVVQLGRRSAYRYDHTRSKRAGLWLFIVFLLNEDTDQDRAWMFFDEEQVLTHVGATFDAESTRFAMPWSGS